MRKKLLNHKMLGVLAVSLILLTTLGAAEEQRTDAGGQWTYVLEDGSATITGVTAEELTGSQAIPDEVDGYPVTGIGDEAFSRCESLAGIIIPKGVTRIGDAAFYWCFSLTNVIIPDSVVSIGEWSFKECFSLENMTIGSGVTGIGGFAFFGCESLSNVVIPDSMTSIGEYAFAHCYSLRSVTIPASVTDIGESAFFDCEELTLFVEEGSYAEQYAEENGLHFTFGEACPEPDALADLIILEGWDAGLVLGAAQSPEGMLLTGISEGWSDGWAVFIDNDGNECWSLGEWDTLYSSPTALPNGGFAVLRERAFDGEMDGDITVSLMILSPEGTVMASPSVPLYARDIVAAGDSLFVLGNQEAEEGGDAFLTCVSGQGEALWTQTYFQPECEELRFKKAVYAEESLIIGADVDVAESEPGICMLYRLDLNGNIIWSVEGTPELGGDSSLHDVCVNEGGIIAMVCGEYAYDEEYGEPLDRLCDVFGLNMDGTVLWNYKMDSGAMADYILPVEGGFLCASQGLGLYYCPYLGEGWVLLLDQEGNVKAENNTPDIGGGMYEVYGMAEGGSGEALLYGTLLDDPGFPTAPFVGWLAFPEAYEPGFMDEEAH